MDPKDIRLQPTSELDWGSERCLFRDVAGDRKGEEWQGAWHQNLEELRMKDAAMLVLDPRPGMRVLDIGSADGAQMVYCGLMGAASYGQDIDEVAVAVANEKLERLGIEGKAVLGDCTDIRFDDSTFDGVISSDFHEHLTEVQQEQVLAEVWRVLRPAGRFVIKTPNLTYLRISLTYKRIRELARGRNPMKLMIPHTPGTDDPQHVGLITRESLNRQLQEAGFKHVRFFHEPPRFGGRLATSIATEIPILRDWVNESLLCVATKGIAGSYFTQ
jgi:SAM-dependent methyltransferase